MAQSCSEKWCRLFTLANLLSGFRSIRYCRALTELARCRQGLIQRLLHSEQLIQNTRKIFQVERVGSV
jgi:hypothetical protein